MTTPERIRRRQFMLGMYFLVVSIALGVFVWYGERKDAAQERRDDMQREAIVRVVECIADNFSDLAHALDARGELTQLESDAVRKVLKTAAEVDGGDDKPIQVALDEYLFKQTEIKEERKENPLPPFPEGKCDQ